MLCYTFTVNKVALTGTLATASHRRPRVRPVAGWMAVAVSIGLAGCRPPPDRVVESSVLNHPMRVEISAEAKQTPGDAAAEAQRLMEGVLKDLDPGRPGSDIYKLNQVANTVRLQVSRSCFRLIDLARHYSERTDGAYDLTAAPLEEVWNCAGGQLAEAPADQLIEGVLAGVGYRFVEIFDQGAVAFTMQGTRIGFRLLGPAYAVDLAILDLRRRGYDNLIIQVGGIHRVLGARTLDQSWTVELPDSMGQVRVGGAKPALAVLQARQPPLQVAGRLYSHVLDPRTGRPSEGTAWVAVLAPSATMAQVLAEALLVAGIGQAPALLAQFPKCEIMVRPDDQATATGCTKGFAQRLKLRDAAAGQPTTLTAETP